MGKHEIECLWQEEMSFDATVNGHHINLNADAEVSGKDRGLRPKPLILVALAGCTSMDVVSLLKKMRVNFTKFNVKVSGELTNEHPKVYEKIDVTYQIWGENIDKEKVEKAVNLSKDRYCGVSAMLSKACNINYLIEYLN